MTEYSKLVGKKRMRVYYKITVQGIGYLDELMEQYKLAFDGISLFFEKMKENGETEGDHVEKRDKKVF